MQRSASVAPVSAGCASCGRAASIQYARGSASAKAARSAGVGGEVGQGEAMPRHAIRARRPRRPTGRQVIDDPD
jgi:hypothetical protein